MLGSPFPGHLLFNLSWREEDIKGINALKLVCSLPSFGYPQQLFKLDNVPSKELNCIYKLQGVICFSGAHYLSLLRVKSHLTDQKQWHLFNDQEIRLFDNFKQIAHFIIESNCVPTVILYEKQVTKKPPTKSDLGQMYTQIDEDDLLMLFLEANERDSNIDALMAD